LVSYQRVVDVIAQDREDIVSGSVPAETQIQGGVTFENVSFAYEPMEVLKEHKKVEKKRKSRKDEPAPEPEEKKAEELKPVEVLHNISFTCAPDRLSRCWDSTGSARPASSICCCASTNTSPATSGWTASNSRSIQSHCCAPQCRDRGAGAVPLLPASAKTSLTRAGAK
jgi:ABC-type multidrug transport system fused ATPase/permease subunit